MGTMIEGPLALIASESGSSSRAIEGTRSSGEGRSSTPPSGSTLGTSPRSTTAGSPSAIGTAEAGDLYVLVFDPSDPESRSAYQMAQSIARSAMMGSTGAYGTQGTSDPLSSQRTPGTQSSDNPSGLQVTPGTSGATSGADRQQGSQRDVARPSGLAGSAEKVKVTGRIIESQGVQAIAVQKVERQHGGSTASVYTPGGN
jgi:hypothetical protein